MLHAKRLDLAIKLCESVGLYALGEFQRFRSLTVETKHDGTVVTAVDRECERRLREGILQEFRDDGVFGEELGEQIGQSGYRWIVDPIDGTRSFVQGVPLWGVMVGIEYAGAYVAGVVGLPAVGELVWAGRGSGCWWKMGKQDAQRASVSKTSRLNQSLISMTSPRTMIEELGSGAFTKLCLESKVTRGWGDCFGHVVVATGRADVMVDPPMALWDIAALVPIVEEAGGKITTLRGESPRPGACILTTNGYVHEEVMKMLAERSR